MTDSDLSKDKLRNAAARCAQALERAIAEAVRQEMCQPFARYAVVCFRGDEPDHVDQFRSLREAHACVRGIALTDIDSRTGEIYDLETRSLCVDPLDWEEDYHGPRAVAAAAALADLAHEYAAQLAQKERS